VDPASVVPDAKTGDAASVPTRAADAATFQPAPLPPAAEQATAPASDADIAPHDDVPATDPNANAENATATDTNEAAAIEANASAARGRQIVFYDPRVSSREQLREELGGDAEFIALDPAGDGIDQIRTVLEDGGPVSAVHILTHGSAGGIALGASALTTETIDARAADLAAWGAALDAQADILIYGCDVGAGATGDAFLSRIAALTGADVSASTDATGSALRGGDWSLEANHGSIETRSLAVDGIEGLLAAPTSAAGSATVAESSFKVFSSSDFAFTDSDAGQTLAFVRITGLPTDGDLYFNGSLVTIDQEIAAASLGNLRFNPANKTANYTATFQFRVRDSAGDLSVSAYTFSIAVTASNNAPTAQADSNSIAEDAANVAGDVLSNDINPDVNESKTVTAVGIGAENGTVGQALAGTYGSLTLQANGSYTYTLNNAHPAVQALAPGQTLTETFRYTMRDGVATNTSSSTLTITIAGTNDAPVVTAPADPSAPAVTIATPVPENASNAENPGTTVSQFLASASGVSLVTDADAADTRFGVAVFGSTTSDGMTGHWEYQLNGNGTWTTFSPSVSAATLLPFDAKIRFVAELTTADATESGTATLKYYAWDGRSGSAGMTIDVSDGNRGGSTPVSLTALSGAINIAPRNDAPKLTLNTITLAERDGSGARGSIVITANLDPSSDAESLKHIYLRDPDNSTDQLMYRLEELPAAGKLYKNNVEMDVGSLFTHEELASGAIKYAYTGGELSGNTTDTFRFSLRDGAGGVIGATGAGGLDPWKTVTIAITDVNAQVGVANTSFTTTEYMQDGDHIDLAGLTPADADRAGSPDGYPRMVLTSLPLVGRLQYWTGSAYADLTAANLKDGGNPVWLDEASIAAHPLRYIPPAGEPSLYGGQVSFMVHVTDGGREGNPALATTTETTITINVTPVNDLPVVITSPISVDRDSADNVIGIDKLTATDEDSAAIKRVYTISAAPSKGYLTLGGVRIGIGATFTQADLDANRLAYTHEGEAPDNNDPTTYEDHFRFTVNDGDGGVASGRLDINVVPKDITGGGPGGTLTATIAEGLFRVIDATMLSGSGSYQLDAAPTHGTLFRDGIALAVGAIFTQADIDGGKIVYVSDGKEPGGYAPSTYRDGFRVVRSGGTVAGTASFTLVVTPVNDAPVIEQADSSTPVIKEHNVDGGDPTADPNEHGAPSLAGVSNATKLTLDNLNGKDVDTADAQLYYVLEKAPDGGTLSRWNGVAWAVLAAGDRFNVSEVAQGKIAYFHNPDSELRNDSVRVYLVDGAVVQAGDVVPNGAGFTEKSTVRVDDGTSHLDLAKGSVARSPTRTVNFFIDNVNDAPAAASTRFTVAEGTGETASSPPTNPASTRVLTTEILAVSDSDNLVTGFDNNGGGYYEITVVPSRGTLYLDGVAVTAGTRFSHAQLRDGLLSYSHDGSEPSLYGYVDSFQYRAADVEGPGAPATVTIDVRPVNDIPKVAGTLILDGAQSVPEGGARKITAAMLGVDQASTDPDNTTNQVQYRITDIDLLHGVLYLGDPVTGAPAKALGIGSAITLKQILEGRLWYQHEGSDPGQYEGKASFGFRISDSSGMGEPAGTFNIRIIPVNDAPLVSNLNGGATFTEGDTAASPNVAPVFIDNSILLIDSDLANNSNDFRGGHLRVGYQSGGHGLDQLGIANLGTGTGQIGISGNDVTFSGVVIGSIDAVENGLNGAALRINFSGGANASLTIAAVKALMEALTFAHTDYNNAAAGVRTLAYTLVDGGGDTDYTDGRGRTFDGRDTWTGTATVTVRAANDRPVLDKNQSGGNIDLGTISENDTTAPASFQVGSFLSAVNGGADATHSGFGDVDTVTNRGIAITDVGKTATGKWQYSANGTSWTDVGTVSATSALLLSATDYLRFLPDGIDGGNATFAYKAWDQSSGSVRTKVDTTSTAQTSAFSADKDTAQVNVTGVNDKPTISGPDVVSATEDTLFEFKDTNALSLADIDSDTHLIMLTLTFAGKGSFQFSGATGNIYSNEAGTAAHTGWSGFGDGSTLTVYGTAGNLRTMLGKLQYTPEANTNNTNLASQPQVRIDVSDLGWEVSGSKAGTAETATKTVVIDIKPVNDDPTITLGGNTVAADENGGATPLAVGITLADPLDADNGSYAADGPSLPYLVLTSLHGNLSFAAAPGVTVVSGNNSRELVLQGTLAALNAALTADDNQVSYRPDASFSGSDTIRLTLHDNGNVGGTDKTATANIAVTVTGFNNRPVFAGLDNTPVFVENATTGVVLDGDASLSDAELSNYGNWKDAVLTLQRLNGPNGDDVFALAAGSGVSFSGSDVKIGDDIVGTYTNGGGKLVITFSGNANNARVDQVLRAITYSNTNDNPTGDVTIAYTINDGDIDPDSAVNDQGTGGALIGTGQVVVTVTATNDRPVLGGLAGTGYIEDATATVLAPDLTVSDPELSWFASQTGNWGGASLTISRTGGASLEDAFGASGNLGMLKEGESVTLAGVAIGTVSRNSGGVLTLSFSDNATSSQVQAALRQITYANSRQSLSAGATANVSLDWTLEDGDSDAPPRSNDQGAGGNLSVKLAQVVTLTGVNDAPVLVDSTLALEQVEDAVVPAGVVGTAVSALTGAIADADSSAPRGIAVTGADSTLGTWYYSIDNGANWSVLPAVSDSNALLLRAADLLYFKPAANVNGTVSAGLTVRAWDQSNIAGKAAGALADTTGNGGTLPYSTATDTVALTVTAVNDAPTRVADRIDIVVAEDNGDPAGSTVSSLFAPAFSDATDNQSAFGGSSAHAMAGVAIVGNLAIADQGKWQYNSGSGWTDLPAVSAGNAFLLQSGDQLRFLPAADFHGTPGKLTVRLIDASGGAVSSGARADLSDDAVKSGGTTRYSNSANAVDLRVTVNAVNDAPTLGGTASLGATDEDTASAAMSAGAIAAALTYGDARDDRSGVAGGGTTATPRSAIAIVGNAAGPAQGRWEYTLDGATWNTVATDVGDSTAIVLDLADPKHQVRFVPAADYNGTPGSLSVRAADGTWNGSGGVTDISATLGGSFAWSASTASVGIVVNAVNDRPAIVGLDATPTFTEGRDTATDRNVLGDYVVIDGSVTITDTELVTQHVDDFNGATLTIARDGGTDFAQNGEDRFGLDPSAVNVASGVISIGAKAVADITTNTAGRMVITFRSAASSSDVNAVASAVTYANTADKPDNQVTLRYRFSDDNQGPQGSGGPLQRDATIHVIIAAVNDPPLAVDDTASITEDAASSVTGNVIHGAGTDTDPEGDTLTVTGVRTGMETGSGTSGTVGAVLTGGYGSLKLEADGSYSYTLDNNNAAVNQLKTGQTLTEVYTYTISDGNGGTDVAQLTITIRGNTDAAPGISASDNNGGATGQAEVYEKGLTDAADTSETTAGTIAVAAADGLASVAVGGVTLTLAELQALAGAPRAIDTSEGTLTLTGFTAGGSVGGVPVTGSIAYSYTLKAALSQAGTESSDAVALAVTDNAGATSSGTLTVRIVDDAPLASADNGAIVEDAAPNTTGGNVLTNDRSGADSSGAQVTTVTADGLSVGAGSSIATTYGSIVIHADGSYTYTLDNVNPAVNALSPTSTPLVDSIGYTLVDGDGDSTTATLSISISGANDAPVLIDAVRSIVQLEDAPMPSGAAGTTIGDILGAGGSSDADLSAAAHGIAVVAADSSLGNWYYSTDGGDHWQAVGSAAENNALLLGPSARLYFVPAADRNTSDGPIGASAPIADGLRFRAWDRSSGTEGGRADASVNGGASAFSSLVDNVRLSVTPVNDGPAIVDLDAVSVNASPTNPYIPGNGGVVIDPDVRFADRELGSERNNWNGARLSIARSGGPSADDLFAARPGGTLVFSSGDLVVGGVTIGSYTNAGGSLTMQFNGNATTALVESAARNLTYANAQATPTESSVTLRWTLDDQNPDTTGGGTAGNGTGQGNGGRLQARADIVISLNQPPVAANDSATAVEAGGIGNGTAGINPSGNVLANDTDPDVFDTRAVVTTGSFAGSYGTLTIAADGSYTYVLNNSLTAVEQLRTAADRLVENFGYTMRDAAGLTSSASLVITIEGANDTPLASDDTATAVEAGGMNNETRGPESTGNVLVNDTDIDAGDSRTVVTSGEFAGQYGRLVLNADGSYRYLVDDAHPAVDALRSGERLTEVFRYTMRDSAGATSSASLTVTIHGAADIYIEPPAPPAPPPVTPEPPPTPVTVPPAPNSGGGSEGSGKSATGSAFFGNAADTFSDQAGRRLELRVTTENAPGANSQAEGSESRKLESTDRGFPVERMKAEGGPNGQVDGQQKGGDRLFVFKGISNTVVPNGGRLDYHVERQAFGHTDPGAIVQLEATLMDGNPLPEWMEFDPTSGTFSGRPPADAEANVEVKVTARDNEGREASTSFKLQIDRAAQQRGDAGPGAEKQADKQAKRPGKDGARGSLPFSEQLKQARRGETALDRLLAAVAPGLAPAKPVQGEKPSEKSDA
jgi:VCBS repeat-containing protein